MLIEFEKKAQRIQPEIDERSKEIRCREGKVALAGLTQYVYEIFEVSAFTAMIPIKETVEEGPKDLAS